MIMLTCSSPTVKQQLQLHFGRVEAEVQFRVELVEQTKTFVCWLTFSVSSPLLETTFSLFMSSHQRHQCVQNLIPSHGRMTEPAPLPAHHPGPDPSRSRRAPEINIFEAEWDKDSPTGHIMSQSTQFAPFLHDYVHGSSPLNAGGVHDR